MMTSTPLEIRLFMPVIDGPIPAQWKIWGGTFERACSDFEEKPRPLPGSYRYLPSARLRINLQTPEELFDRTNNQWSFLAGALVDGGGELSDQDAIFDRLLKVWSYAQSANAIYQKLKRFPIGFLLPNWEAFNQSASDFSHKLEVEGTNQLKVRVESHPVTTSRSFCDMMRSIEWQIVRDWMNREREAA